MAKKLLTCTAWVRINGVLHKWDDFSEEEKNEIGATLNRQAMESLGFKAVEKDRNE